MEAHGNRFLEEYEAGLIEAQLDMIFKDDSKPVVFKEIVSGLMGLHAGYVSGKAKGKTKQSFKRSVVDGAKTQAVMDTGIGAVTGTLAVNNPVFGAASGAVLGGAGHAVGYTVGQVAKYFKQKFGRDASKEELADKLDKLKKRGVQVDDGASISDKGSGGSEGGKKIMVFGHWRDRKKPE